MSTGFHERLFAGFAAAEKRDFLVSPSQRLSYQDAARGIRRWLALFDRFGLASGDRIVLRTDRDDVACIAFIAALVDGKVPVLLEGGCPDARFLSTVQLVEPALAISDGHLPDLPGATQGFALAEGASGQGFRFLQRRKGGAEFGLECDPATRAPALSGATRLAYLLFTSGSTAEPSGVEVTQDNLAANLDTLSCLFDYDPQSRIFNDMILAHADGMIQGPMLAAWNKAAVLRAGGFELQHIEDWLACVRRFRATHVLSVPTVWSLIDSYAAHDDYFDGPECRVLMTVAAKMPEPLWERIESRFSRPLVNHYGLTETVASALYAGHAEELGAWGTIGRPLDCEARIANGGDEGELQLRGANVFSGYWRNPERTARSFTEDGWFRTGDLARARDDGSYEVLGRIKSVIMSGGVLIRPDEIDEAMLRHPAVAESATVGVSDRFFGEVGVTCVVLNEDLDEAELTEHQRLYVEPRKVSKRILAVPSIPRGPSGKVTLDALRAVIASRTDEPAAGGDRVVLSDDVLDLAAGVFRVPRDQVSLRTTPDTLKAWDSFTQLNLVLSVESHFGCRIPAASVSKLRSLADVVTAVEELS